MELYVKQVALILGCSDKAALKMVCDTSGEDPHLHVKNETIGSARCDLDKFAAKHQLDMRAFLKDINENFGRSSRSVEWLIDLMNKKIKPNKDGLYPISITIPKYVDELLNDASKVRIRELVRCRLLNRLKINSGKPSFYEIKIV